MPTLRPRHAGRMSFHHRRGERWLSVPDDLQDRVKILGKITVDRVEADEWWFQGRHQKDRRWTVAYRMIRQHDYPVIAEARIFPTEPGRQAGEWSGSFIGPSATVPEGGITARLLKHLRPGDTRQSDVREGRAAWERYLKIPDVRAYFNRAGFRRLRKPRSRQGKWSERELLEAVAFYAGWGGGTPVMALAKMKGITRAQARDLLQAASKKGFLMAGRPGVKSRQLTARARQLLVALKGRQS